MRKIDMQIKLKEIPKSKDTKPNKEVQEMAKQCEAKES